MSNLLFGLFWTIITILCTIPIFTTGTDINIFFVLMIILFWIIGIFLIVRGIKKIITNKNTEKYGEDCYGVVKSIYPNGTRINNNPMYNVEVAVYIPSKQTMVSITEEIGMNPGKYPLESIVKVKYYNNDINIKEVVDYNTIPLDIRDQFEGYEPSMGQTSNINTNTEAADVVTINGVQYKRMDSTGLDKEKTDDYERKY